MNEKSTYKNKLSGFAERLKTEPAVVAIQTVNPISTVNPVEKVEEIQLNVWIPKALMKQLKAKGLDIDKSMKEMVNEALSNYLTQ
ncbi:hypothetical protein [Runella salmonicolor]|uniref:CopG family transcriptional regulator n=1 Tax=Runella salmonicolor TaxID=2950278 RepID=A0ABT1FWX0_9BACT|nr:hypothetical protein [Runella salmonicolor]MCP1386266.1 hypothetical protein [Runella salmonicolor]